MKKMKWKEYVEAAEKVGLSARLNELLEQAESEGLEGEHSKHAYVRKKLNQSLSKRLGSAKYNPDVRAKVEEKARIVRQEAEEEKAELESRIDELESENPIKMVRKKVFEGKPVPKHQEIVEWVFNNVSVQDIKPSDAPCAGAWQWLADCRASSKERASLRQIWSKLLPTKQQIEQGAFSDDGREQFDLLDRVLNEN